ncbi:hypothetical protein ACFLRF_02840 [Candidatus Altiarchaeota archaeon]
MEDIPTIKEIEESGFLADRELTPPEKVSLKWKQDSDRRTAAEYRALNLMAFTVFAVPVILALFLFGPEHAGFFYNLVAVWVHEAGHGLLCPLGDRFMCSLAGTLSELVATIVPALILFTDRRSLLAACILFMCAGFSLEHAGVYMQSSMAPRGVGFGGIPMNRQTHDFHIVFSRTGLLYQSYNIGVFSRDVGKSLAMIFLTASILGVIPVLSGWVPSSRFQLISPAAIIITIYFFLVGASWTCLNLGMLLAAPPILSLIYSRLRNKPNNKE